MFKCYVEHCLDGGLTACRFWLETLVTMLKKSSPRPIMGIILSAL